MAKATEMQYCTRKSSKKCLTCNSSPACNAISCNKCTKLCIGCLSYTERKRMKKVKEETAKKQLITRQHIEI